jgi:hypothetical protein
MRENRSDKKQLATLRRLIKRLDMRIMQTFFQTQEQERLSEALRLSS